MCPKLRNALQGGGDNNQRVSNIQIFPMYTPHARHGQKKKRFFKSKSKSPTPFQALGLLRHKGACQGNTQLNFSLGNARGKRWDLNVLNSKTAMPLKIQEGNDVYLYVYIYTQLFHHFMHLLNLLKPV